MFKFVLICAIVGLTAALPLSDESNAETIKLINEVLPNGFNYVLETTNQISSQRTGDGYGNIQGVDSWVSPEGVPVVIKFVADENGYQPQGELLPTPPPIPDAIVRSIAYIAANPSKESLN